MNADQLEIGAALERDLDAALEAADEGMRKARAAQRAQAWRARAEAWLDDVPSGAIFTADELVETAGLPDVGTNRNNAVGALFSAWSKAGRIAATGNFVVSERKVRHGAPHREWRKT
jgi:hypothetical protein